MRPPRILDVVQAVADLAPVHPEIAVWWYAPADRGPGSRAAAAATAARVARPVVVVVEPADGVAPDLGVIGSDLSRRLRDAPVAVRVHRGAAETEALYRLVTRAG